MERKRRRSSRPGLRDLPCPLDRPSTAVPWPAGWCGWHPTGAIRRIRVPNLISILLLIVVMLPLGAAAESAGVRPCGRCHGLGDGARLRERPSGGRLDERRSMLRMMA